MSSQAKSDDPFCLECHWETFHIDGREPENTSNVDHHSQWDCSGEEHHTSSDNCDVDEACCDVDDCSVDCGSVCDGFVDCDASTVCSISHCDDNNCQGEEPVCFDEHCFEDDHGTENGLESLLGLGGPLNLETHELISPTTVDHSQIEQPAKHIDHTVPDTVNPHHCHNAFFAPYPTPTAHCHSHSHVAHHFDCHNFAKPADESLAHSYPIQNEVNPADVFHMLGMCSDFSSCEDNHVHEDHHAHGNLGKLDENPPSVPFASCFHQGHHGHHGHHHLNVNAPVKNPMNLSGHTLHSNGPCRTHHHRCRTHTHAHSHPYSPYSRHSRSSVSSHLISSPGETPPPLEGGTSSSVLTSPEFTPVDSEIHICKWVHSHHGVKAACGATFSDAGTLQEHMISSHMTTVDGAKGNGYYCCWEGCHRPDEPFSQKSKLQGHFLTHSNHKNFKCSVCGKFFARQATLDRHERSHRGEKPYKCADCGKTFTDSSELKTHSRTHTGEKPFKCTYPGCNFQTGDSSNMSSHRLTHGERRHKCHFAGCTKSFTRPDQLKRHLKTTHKQDSPTLPSPMPEQFMSFEVM